MANADDKLRPAGPMQRQQTSGGRHDLLSNQRQREPHSSRGEQDLTLARGETQKGAHAPGGATGNEAREKR